MGNKHRWYCVLNQTRYYCKVPNTVTISLRRVQISIARKKGFCFRILIGIWMYVLLCNFIQPPITSLLFGRCRTLLGIWFQFPDTRNSSEIWQGSILGSDHLDDLDGDARIMWHARLFMTVAKQRTDKHATMGSPCNSRGIVGVFFAVRSPAITRTSSWLRS
jgi:hypothetical protein